MLKHSLFGFRLSAVVFLSLLITFSLVAAGADEMNSTDISGSIFKIRFQLDSSGPSATHSERRRRHQRMSGRLSHQMAMLRAGTANGTELPPGWRVLPRSSWPVDIRSAQGSLPEGLELLPERWILPGHQSHE